MRFDESLLTTLGPAELPAGWNAFPPPPAVQAIGDRWARASTSAVLALPSVLVPHERNYLLSPVHPDFPRIEIGVQK